MEFNLDQFFAWFAGTDRETRGYFGRRYFDNLPDDELATITNLANSAKHRRKRKRQRVADLATGTPDPKAVALGQGSRPVKATSSPQPWWKKFDFANILAMDVEKVQVPNPKGKPKYFQLAGEVALVDFNGLVVFKKKIQRAPGSFRTNYHANNGFYYPDCLANGTPLEIVQDGILELLNGKLLVGVAIENDLESLGLSMQQIGAEVFDLQWHWYREDMNKDGRLVNEKLVLRSLCKHYFQFDMQPEIPKQYRNKNGPKPFHQCDVDALWTMDLFKCVYMPLNCLTKENPHPSNEVKYFKQLYV